MNVNCVVKEVRRRRSFVPVTVRENLDWEEMVRIQVNAPDLPGVIVNEGLTRFYPQTETAAHVLGYVSSVDEEDLTGDPLLQLPGFRIGKQGMEREFDLVLRGSGGNSQVEVNALGRVIRELERKEAGSRNRPVFDFRRAPTAVYRGTPGRGERR